MGRTCIAIMVLMGIVFGLAPPAPAQTASEPYVEELLNFAIEVRKDSKYAGSPFFANLARLPDLRKKAVEVVRDVMGLDYMDRFTIVMRFLDQNEDGARKYNGLHAQRITVNSAAGETQMILFFLEYFKNGQADLEKKIIHEMSHAIMRELMTREDYVRIPKWVREGTAVFVAGQLDHRATHILSLRAEGNPFSVVSDLKQRHSGTDYMRDAMVFRYLVEKYGGEKFKAFVRGLVKDRLPVEKAMTRALGLPFEQFRKDALAHVLARIRRLASAGDLAYKEAFQLYRLRSFRAAQARFSDIISRHPDSYAASASSYYLAKCYYYQKAYGKAKAAFMTHILKYSGRSGLVDDAKYYIGLCFYQQGNFAGSADVFSELVRDYPYARSVLPKAYYYRGLSLLKIDRKGEARKALAHVRDWYPKSKVARSAAQELTKLDTGPETPKPPRKKDGGDSEEKF